MIDPLVSLAFSLYSNRGAYALLLGSGISRSSEIMTGWEITLDLVRRIAALEGAADQCNPDPERWYVARFGTHLDYSDVLDQLSTTSADRRQILRSYFEPTGEDREQGRKQPSAAHKAVAQLVKEGYVRVIVTTNFDRLMEEALRSEGIEPQIIASPDAADGAVPLVHEKCTLMKLHGDYLDTRIKNTPKELESYDGRIDRLLDQIFDEYGLIVCGWSAAWDGALRSALDRCKNLRFSTFWTSRGEPGDEARRLLGLRKGIGIKIQDADTFFVDIVEKVLALESIGARNPLTSRIAVARLKKYIENKELVSLADLMKDETEQLASYLQQLDDSTMASVGQRVAAFQQFLSTCEAKSETLQVLVGTGCYWGEEIHRKIWADCLQRIVNSVEHLRQFDENEAPALYPALLILYAGGIGAIAGRRYSNLKTLFHEVNVDRWGQTVYGNILLNTCFVLGPRLRRILSDSRWFIFSNRIRSHLRTNLKKLVPDEQTFLRSFDRFEYLQNLDFIALRDISQEKDLFGEEPLGEFVINFEKSKEAQGVMPGKTWNIVEEIDSEVKRLQENWPPLKAGLCGGSVHWFDSSRQVIGSIIEDFFLSGSRRRCH
jgi:hypothetical protein